MSDKKVHVNSELRVLNQVMRVLAPLDPAAQSRVLNYASEMLAEQQSRQNAETK